MRVATDDNQHYHTALSHGVRIHSSPRQSAESQHGVAFVHDLCSGALPEAYSACDVLYAELPWRAGLAEFDKRAGVAVPRNYQAFMRAVAKIILETKQRAFMVTGRQGMRYLPYPSHLLETTLNGASCIVMAYTRTPRGRMERTDFNSTADLLHWLAGQFSCIGDFCCGYGRAGRIFAEHGKRFVMSDYNAECVGYIGDTL